MDMLEILLLTIVLLIAVPTLMFIISYVQMSAWMAAFTEGLIKFSKQRTNQAKQESKNGGNHEES